MFDASMIHWFVKRAYGLILSTIHRDIVPTMQDASGFEASPFTEPGFRRLAGRALLAASPLRSPGGAGPSDFDLNPELAAAGQNGAPLLPAAVLIPIVARRTLSVIFTQRTDALPRHAGQISFPGGKMEPGESEPVVTALREANEEIGLLPEFVEPLGYLDPYRTGTGYRIYPVVALIREGFSLKLDEREVADAFEVPLAFLMDASNHKTHMRVLAGAERHFHAMPFEERYIWGATAGIMKNMHERLFPS
jgi:8-oxo-dGTP pyrophosphatase MutT (NUDIX family)